ncbi:hypothetical protein NTE_03494 [Candidatus Nitrososphaera evergladensis SR1]|uniref:Uncharacterized protein n=2 Tax=Nitrososphaera TaxID=497726 RepID=A0A075MY02_9ARCH|nr:hypothetical protein NTE_03494 [Candidatus Nitrososphaera evergladensis SR1]
MDRDFIILAAILVAIGLAGIYAGLISHPIMYINSAVLFGYAGYVTWQSFRVRKAATTRRRKKEVI